MIFALVWLTLLFLPERLVAQEKYIASYAGFAGFQAPLWAAKDFGFMAQYGVNTDLVMIPGSARGAQALLGGSIYFGQIDGTALIAAINQGAEFARIDEQRLFPAVTAWVWQPSIIFVFREEPKADGNLSGVEKLTG